MGLTISLVNFKKSNTYLRFIADRVIKMTLEVYQNSVKMVAGVSALVIHHVGYVIPTELLGLLVPAGVEVPRTITRDMDTCQGGAS